MSDTITFEEFKKVDIRIGTIIACENVPKSEKLLKLQVDFGKLGQRQILSGIAKWFDPEELVGVQTTFVYNMPTRKMMGLESQGMLFEPGEDENMKPIFLTPEEEIENGVGCM